MDTDCVLCEVRPEYVYIMQINFIFDGVNVAVIHLCFYFIYKIFFSSWRLAFPIGIARSSECPDRRWNLGRNLQTTVVS